MHSLQRSLLTVALVGLTSAFSATAVAQFSIVPMIGYTLDAAFDLDFEAEEANTKGALLLGLAVEVPVMATPSLAVSIRPGFELLMIGDQSDTFTFFGETYDLTTSQSRSQFNGDVIVEMLGMEGVRPFFGAGLAYVNYSLDFAVQVNGMTESASESNSAVGLNLLGGVVFDAGPVSPLIQIRYTLADPTPDDDEFVDDKLGNALSIMGGVRITI